MASYLLASDCCCVSSEHWICSFNTLPTLLCNVFMCTVREEKLQKGAVNVCPCAIRQTHFHKIWYFEF